MEDEKKEIPEEIKKQMVAVLKEFVTLGVIGRAFDTAGVPRKKHAEWMAEYPIYKERFLQVKDTFVDGLELEAIRRAMDKSDTLLAMMLRAHRAETYGNEATINHKVNGSPIQLIFAEGMLTDEEKKIINGGVNDGEASNIS